MLLIMVRVEGAFAWRIVLLSCPSCTINAQIFLQIFYIFQMLFATEYRRAVGRDKLLAALWANRHVAVARGSGIVRLPTT